VSAVTQVRRGIVLYDGQCGFCSRWVRYWARILERWGFAVASLDEPWVAEKIKTPREEVLTDIRLLTADGQLISGADVYLYVTRRIWWAWPFYALFQSAGVQPIDPSWISAVCAEPLPHLARLPPWLTLEFPAHSGAKQKSKPRTLDSPSLGITAKAQAVWWPGEDARRSIAPSLHRSIAKTAR
jgi:predicted DCC family thiol-disulfide oxidoreductase YuxK